MEVDDAAGESVEQEVWHQRQETSQNNELYAVLLHERKHEVGVIELCFRGNSRRDTELAGTLQSLGIGFIADNQGTVDALAVSEIMDKVLAVGSTA